ncbi:undecaprenyl-diphosphatase, partial [Acinetobacter baumannii]
VLGLLGIPLAWARIYLGVHFPFDMAGAAFVAMLSTTLIHHLPHGFLSSTYNVAIRIHCRIFSRFIVRGWIRGAT